MHGSLRLEDPEQSWTLKTADGSTILAASTPGQPSDLADLSTPCGGDVILEVSDTYSLVAQGDNLTAEFALSWEGTPSQGTFRVTDQSQQSLQQGAIGATDQAAQAAIPPGTTSLTVTQSYSFASCDPFGATSIALYGDHSLEVRQT
ncbi:MAG: hypothetical protein LBE08_08870 [Bifidobacteriaceae bacterium]|jgi:hypothetical protein|nr:hypothetical protein [Bifidobacteriaceae bacterium]